MKKPNFLEIPGSLPIQRLNSNVRSDNIKKPWFFAAFVAVLQNTAITSEHVIWLFDSCRHGTVPAWYISTINRNVCHQGLKSRKVLLRILQQKKGMDRERMTEQKSYLPKANRKSPKALGETTKRFCIAFVCWNDDEPKIRVCKNRASTIFFVLQ